MKKIINLHLKQKLVNDYINQKLGKVACRICSWDPLFLQGINLKISLEGADKLQSFRILSINLSVDLGIIYNDQPRKRRQLCRLLRVGWRINQPFLDVRLKKFWKNTKIKKMKLELPSRPVFSLEFKTWTLVLVCTLVHTVLTGNSSSFLMQLFKSTMDMLQMLMTYQKWLLKVL